MKILPCQFSFKLDVTFLPFTDFYFLQKRKFGKARPKLAYFWDNKSNLLL
jgi:hypothetical protein